jgi:tetratricopeptide (TPR) repeat protein
MSRGFLNGGVVTTGLAVACLGAAIGVHVDRERRYPARRQVTESLLYIPSGEALKRMALSYDALLADVYWIRAVQHFGGTRLAKRAIKSYDLLYPLLDITTTLDPQFNIAYRFGAIFLSEVYPNGPGKPDLAVKLLQKGFAANPRRWEYLHDIGFVYYWWVRDFQAASTWFARASQVPGAPEWLAGTAARTLAVGGDRQSARAMWQQIYETSEIAYMKDNARFYLGQLQAMDDLERLNAALARVEALEGHPPTSWSALAARGWLRRVPPVDPSGWPYQVNRETGRAELSPKSEFYPLPADMPAGTPSAPPGASTQAGS